MTDNDKITVCDKCLRASCWHSDFLCNEAQTAGTVEKTVKELRKLKLEHPGHWERQLNILKKRRINIELSKQIV